MNARKINRDFSSDSDSDYSQEISSDEEERVKKPVLLKRKTDIQEPIKSLPSKKQTEITIPQSIMSAEQIKSISDSSSLKIPSNFIPTSPPGSPPPNFIPISPPGSPPPNFIPTSPPGSPPPNFIPTSPPGSPPNFIQQNQSPKNYKLITPKKLIKFF